MHIRLLLIDALNLIRRVYAAQPGEDGVARTESALTASIQSLERALRECGPTHAVSIFDSQGKGWRHELFPDYKAGRESMPETLYASLPQFKAAFSECGVSSLEFSSMEADDIIGTLAHKTAENGGNVIILSTDKVFFQLLSKRIIVRDHFNRKDLDAEYVKERYGVYPEQFEDFLALSGDTTNNISGVAGVGPKRAAKFLNEIGNLEDILAVAHTIPGKPGEMLYRHGDDARLSKQLVALKTDLSFGLNLRDLRYIRGEEREKP
ncbi:MAG: flap endonuclease Xni [Deltaproteobacteria bacterium]|nr:flap endonuclease Xni [Deltaproteobacteria bacterium]